MNISLWLLVMSVWEVDLFRNLNDWKVEENCHPFAPFIPFVLWIVRGTTNLFGSWRLIASSVWNLSTSSSCPSSVLSGFSWKQIWKSNASHRIALFAREAARGRKFIIGNLRKRGKILVEQLISLQWCGWKDGSSSSAVPLFLAPLIHGFSLSWSTSSDCWGT